MSAIYCSNCGIKHEYSYAKPKFCSSCGNPMGAQPLKPTVAQRAAPDEDYEDDDGDEDSSNSSYVPQLRRLQVDVEPYSEGASFTLGSLFGENSPPSQPRRNRAKNLDDFISEKPRRGEQQP